MALSIAAAGADWQQTKAAKFLMRPAFKGVFKSSDADLIADITRIKRADIKRHIQQQLDACLVVARKSLAETVASGQYYNGFDMSKVPATGIATLRSACGAWFGTAYDAAVPSRKDAATTFKTPRLRGLLMEAMGVYFADTTVVQEFLPAVPRAGGRGSLPLRARNVGSRVAIRACNDVNLPRIAYAPAYAESVGLSTNIDSVMRDSLLIVLHAAHRSTGGRVDRRVLYFANALHNVLSDDGAAIGAIAAILTGACKRSQRRTAVRHVRPGERQADDPTALFERPRRLNVLDWMVRLTNDAMQHYSTDGANLTEETYRLLAVVSITLIEASRLSIAKSLATAPMSATSHSATLSACRRPYWRRHHRHQR
ncbi:hypothetical protein U1Q18_051580 [Sarracenia purpurea var. burkii]